MLTINFRGMTPVRARWVPPGRDLDPHRPGAARERRAWRRVLGERFSAYRGPRLHEHLAASLFAFSATFEICRNDRSCHHGESPNRGRARDSLIRARISLFAQFNSLQGRKKFPVRMRRELARKSLS